jgi:hypothetical protein
VRRRIAPGAKRERQQRGENRHVHQRNNIERRHILAGVTRGAHQRIGGGQHAMHHHQTSEKEPRDSQTAMDVHPPGGNQGGLCDQQQDREQEKAAPCV